MNADSNETEYAPFTGRENNDFARNYKFRSYLDQLPLNQILMENEQFIVLWIHKSQFSYGFSGINPLKQLRQKTLKICSTHPGNSDYGYNENRYLLLFDKKTQKIVALNGLGYVDNGRKQREGKKLINKNLFSIDDTLWNTAVPILVIGNLLLNDGYRQNKKALRLWWRGLGKYVGLHPSCKFLMSLVTLGSQYEAISRQLAITFFNKDPYMNERSKYVEPMKPYQSTPVKSWNNNAFTEIFQEVEELNTLIAEFESDQQGLPLPFRYYLNLGAEFLGFSAVPDDENSIIGLTWIDLTNADLDFLELFMGQDDAEFYLKQH